MSLFLRGTHMVYYNNTKRTGSPTSVGSPREHSTALGSRAPTQRRACPRRLRNHWPAFYLYTQLTHKYEHRAVYAAHTIYNRKERKPTRIRVRWDGTVRVTLARLGFIDSRLLGPLLWPFYYEMALNPDYPDDLPFFPSSLPVFLRRTFSWEVVLRRAMRQASRVFVRRSRRVFTYGFYSVLKGLCLIGAILSREIWPDRKRSWICFFFGVNNLKNGIRVRNFNRRSGCAIINNKRPSHNRITLLSYKFM